MLNIFLLFDFLNTHVLELMCFPTFLHRSKLKTFFLLHILKFCHLKPVNMCKVFEFHITYCNKCSKSKFSLHKKNIYI